MKRKPALVGISLGLCVWLSMASAQEEVFQRGVELGIGARALGMAGAYIGIADDYSASFWNPAALAQIRRLEGFGTLSYALRENDASFATLHTVDELSSTDVNSIGLAYPVPTYRGSLVFSIGYHQVKPFDSSLRYEWFNAAPSDSVTQRWSEIEEGSLNNWVFAGALEVAPNLSLGAALNVWRGDNDYLFSFEENDMLFDLYTFHNFRIENTIRSEFSGVNVKFGGLYRPMSFFRLGFTVATPITYTVKEKWRSKEETYFDDSDNVAGPDSAYVPDPLSGNWEYKIRSPFSFGVGASLNVANLLLAASIENNDWSQVRYKTEPPIEGLSLAQANEELARKYRNTLRYRLGAELTLPIIDLQVRGGYFYDPSPLKGLPADADREFLTAGLGIFLDKQVRLDVGVITGQWYDYKAPLSDFSDDEIQLSEKITYNKIVASLAVRF
ncbi:MAG: outer membrane protein transport protein [candidate division KSB1 bacterium]|nr:outer membrane protein transport protein [candidate division KSB1 bacterium]